MPLMQLAHPKSALFLAHSGSLKGAQRRCISRKLSRNIRRSWHSKRRRNWARHKARNRKSDLHVNDNDSQLYIENFLSGKFYRFISFGQKLTTCQAGDAYPMRLAGQAGWTNAWNMRAGGMLCEALCAHSILAARDQAQPSASENRHNGQSRQMLFSSAPIRLGVVPA
jgi:hypothetical protein